MEFRNAYFEGKIVPYGDAKVGLATHALNYGTAVFGGLRDCTTSVVPMRPAGTRSRNSSSFFGLTTITVACSNPQN